MPGIHYILKYSILNKNTVISNSNYISQYYGIYCIFDQINAAFGNDKETPFKNLLTELFDRTLIDLALLK